MLQGEPIYRKKSTLHTGIFGRLKKSKEASTFVKKEIRSSSMGAHIEVISDDSEEVKLAGNETTEADKVMVQDLIDSLNKQIGFNKRTILDLEKQ